MFVMSSVVETSHEISPCAALSRDDIGGVMAFVISNVVERSALPLGLSKKSLHALRLVEMTLGGHGSNGNLTRAQAAVMVGVVDHAELARGHAMNLVLRVNSELRWAGPL